MSSRYHVKLRVAECLFKTQESRAFLDLGLRFAGNGLDYWMTILLSLRVRYLS